MTADQLYADLDVASAKLKAAKRHLSEEAKDFLANASEENGIAFRFACWEVEQAENEVHAARMALARVQA